MRALQGQGAAGKQNQMWAALSSLPGPRAPRVPVGWSDARCPLPHPAASAASRLPGRICPARLAAAPEL